MLLESERDLVDGMVRGYGLYGSILYKHRPRRYIREKDFYPLNFLVLAFSLPSSWRSLRTICTQGIDPCMDVYDSTLYTVHMSVRLCLRPLCLCMCVFCGRRENFTSIL